MVLSTGREPVHPVDGIREEAFPCHTPCTVRSEPHRTVGGPTTLRQGLLWLDTGAAVTTRQVGLRDEGPCIGRLALEVLRRYYWQAAE